MVARLIEQVDGERLAIARELGYDLPTDPHHSLQQGYADTDTDYYGAYKSTGGTSAFASFASPLVSDSHPLANHRYLTEDCGHGLMLLISLGSRLGVPTPACDAIVTLASIVTGHDFKHQKRRTVALLGLDDLDADGIRHVALHGTRPAVSAAIASSTS